MLPTDFAPVWKSDSAAVRSSACSTAPDLRILHFPANSRFGAESASSLTKPSRPALAPGLQHQHVPEQILPVAAAVDVLLPEPANDFVVQQCGIAQAVFVEQGLSPVAQRPAQPFAQRNAKSHFRPFDKFSRNMPVQQLPENPLCSAVAHL